MRVLWDLGSGTVADVRERLPDELAYTTVLSLLRTLETKGYVRHTVEGRAHRYHPKIRQRSTGKGALARVVESVFGGSAELAAAELVSDRRIDTRALKRLRALIDERLPKGER